jgi:3-oxocholest-4-en-26-oyl-CoA dehydrogenase alpha subunit
MVPLAICWPRASCNPDDKEATVDFGVIKLEDEYQRFQDEISALLDEHVAELGAERRRFGADEVFDPALIAKLAARGLIQPSWPVEYGGAGLDALHQYILTYELHRRGYENMGGDLVWAAVEKFGQPDLVEELRPKVARGEVHFCLGYTEPDGGSDIAAAKTRAVREGDEWIINGSKMFTTNAHLSQYIFLITRTDPEQPKHRGLTMFLVPTDWPGVEIHALDTIGDERTNITYYGDVRLPDRYRIGAANDGWTVVHGPLDAEHDVGQNGGGLAETMGVWATRRTPTYVAFDAAVEWARTSVRSDGSHPIEDPTVRMRLGRVAADIEVARCTQGYEGRVAGGEVNLRAAAELMDIIGAEALLPYGADGAIDGGDVERAHQFAQPTITYGGSVEVFRDLVTRFALGLPRPHYPGSKVLVNARR